MKQKPDITLNGFDYANQAWVVKGVYVRCGHPETMSCGCFGRRHAGMIASRDILSGLNRAEVALLAHYGTRYEVAAIKGDRRILIGYTSRTSFPGLLSIARKHGHQLIDVCQVHPTQLFVWNKTLKQIELDAWVIKATGRTQRSAIIEGELPFIVDEWNKIGSEVTA